MADGKPVPAHEIVSEFSNISRDKFPNEFVFGVATSAHQVEGAAAKGGRGLCVWNDFALRTPQKIHNGSNGNEAVDMYHRYKEDIKMMKSMGFDAYRFSISWSRILPGGKLCLGVNREGIDYYNDLINTLIANHLEPFVTLFHWDLPLTLELDYGGFLSEDIVNDFRDFAELCFWEFGDRVKYWITFNEPWTYCVRGYVELAFPPGERGVVATYSGFDPALVDQIGHNIDSYEKNNKSGNNFIPYRGSHSVDHDLNFFTYSVVDDPNISIPTKESLLNNNKVQSLLSKIGDLDGSQSKRDLAKDAYTAARNMLLAHAAAVQSYRARFKQHQKGKIGITLVTHWFEPLHDHSNKCKDKAKKDKAAAKRGLDFMLGWFLEPVLVGRYPENMKNFVPEGNLTPFSKEESNSLKGSIDFLGLNYYTARYAEDDPNPVAVVGYNRDQKVKYHSERNNKPIGEKSGAEWLYIVPWGFRSLLKYINDTYNNSTYRLPSIYITENGVAEKMEPTKTAYKVCRDKQRVEYYRDHLGNLLKAIDDDHVKLVKGYFAWTYSDNFEWADGYNYRFGLIYIDYVNHLKRYPKDSAVWFAKFLEKPKTKTNMKTTMMILNKENEEQHNETEESVSAIEESMHATTHDLKVASFN